MVREVVQKTLQRRAYMVRDTDDSVFCFEYKEDAIKFYNALIERLAKFKLEVAEDKTRIIELYQRKDDKDDTDPFDFLGFTFYIDKNPNKFGFKEIK